MGIIINVQHNGKKTVTSVPYTEKVFKLETVEMIVSDTVRRIMNCTYGFGKWNSQPEVSWKII